MTANHLGPAIDRGRLAEGYGFGRGVAVRDQTGVAGRNGSLGDYNWGGAFGTWFSVDPKEQLAIVYMAHTPSSIRVHYRQLLAALIYQAIAD
jgi:CubicO group peptidase (beta-lactamase class C family)